jgi:hypothetical protein
MECSCHAWRCPDKQHGQVVRGEMRSTRRHKTRGVGVSTHQPCGRVVAGRHVLRTHHAHACNDCIPRSVYLMFEDEVVRVTSGRARHTDGSLLTEGDRVISALSDARCVLLSCRSSALVRSPNIRSRIVTFRLLQMDVAIMCVPA